MLVRLLSHFILDMSLFFFLVFFVFFNQFIWRRRHKEEGPHHDWMIRCPGLLCSGRWLHTRLGNRQKQCLGLALVVEKQLSVLRRCSMKSCVYCPRIYNCWMFHKQWCWQDDSIMLCLTKSIITSFTIVTLFHYSVNKSILITLVDNFVLKYSPTLINTDKRGDSLSYSHQKFFFPSARR